MLVTDGVRRGRGRASNIYLVEADDPTLVDAGTPWDAGVVRDLLKEGGHEPADVSRVLLTHYDLDHVGSLGNLGLDCPVYAAEPDAGYLAGDRRPPWRGLKGAAQRVSRPLVPDHGLPVTRVSDFETVAGFVAHRTPGHTPGHLTWVHESLRTAFVGDLVRESDGRLVASPWYLSDDTAEVRSSIKRLRDRNPAVDWLCPGHGDPVDGGLTALPHP
jgi:glyoxylase-like metal-dependent hydrolase (beta-lactamase superfamily II)